LPNKRLKLPGDERSNGTGVLCPWRARTSSHTRAPASGSPAAYTWHHKVLGTQRYAEAAEARGVRVGGNHAEVAATHSRCNRDGRHVGSRVVRCGPRAEVGVWRLYRRSASSRLRSIRPPCRGGFLRGPRADRGASQVRSDVASALCRV